MNTSKRDESKYCFKDSYNDRCEYYFGNNYISFEFNLIARFRCQKVKSDKMKVSWRNTYIFS